MSSSKQVNIKPVILAGGSGSRLWPKSRKALPKQFLSLTSDYTMLQETIKRLDGINTLNPVVICNDDHRFLVAEQLRQTSGQHGGILLEPVGRNTAPAIALSALHAMSDGSDPVLLVLAADHLIKDIPSYHQAIADANLLAVSGKLVTFGIVPSCAHTGYGYIKKGTQVGPGYEVAQFVEKPQLIAAQEYVDSGEYFWNSGMFMFKASRYLHELERYAPKILRVCQKAMETEAKDLEFVRIDPEVFAECPNDSVDYAVMEQTEDATMVPLNAGWNDVGSWASLWETAESKDPDNNVIIGDAILEDVQNSYINSEQRLISVIGLDNVAVVETKDAVMVAHKDKVQSIKNVVERLKQEQRPEFEFHREVFRPWGSYDGIDGGSRFQVKRIKVKPGEKLSVQMHHHRAEHWIVVKGTALVTLGKESFLVAENESTYIPVGEVHALENPGKITLELIEVQSGSYLGEDDIVRFSDRYGRTANAVAKA